jgi:hypothetical protein
MRNAYLELLEKQDSEYALRIDKAIKLFCKAWLEWVDVGVPHGQIMFSIRAGLCDNLTYWMLESGYTFDDRTAAIGVMTTEFYNRYGSLSFPFSKGEYGYAEEREKGTIHLNEARLAWAREKAAMLEKENV